MKIKFIIVLTILSNYIYGQFANKSELKTVTKEIISIIKKHSLVRDSTDWDKFNSMILNDIVRLPLDSSIYIISKIFNELKKNGDDHSFYLSKTELSRDRSFLYCKDMPLPNSKLLEKNIGYLQLPSHRCMNYEINLLYADTLIKQIQFLDENNTIIGWVIDLRQNRGGNMYPMLAGLSPIFNGKNIGYFTSDKVFSRDRVDPMVKYILKGIEYKCKNLNTKVAVLIDTMTASSGEMTAICLLGLNDSKSFGLCSAGYTTMPNLFTLSNGACLMLSSQYFMDRNKKIYKKKIKPDVEINNEDIIKEAIKWINE